MTLRPNNNRTVDESVVPKRLMGTGGKRRVGLDSTEGKDPKRTRMRTLGDDIGVYILLQAVLHEASACTLGQVK